MLHVKRMTRTDTLCMPPLFTSLELHLHTVSHAPFSNSWVWHLFMYVIVCFSDLRCVIYPHINMFFSYSHTLQVTLLHADINGTCICKIWTTSMLVHFTSIESRRAWSLGAKLSSQTSLSVWFLTMQRSLSLQYVSAPVGASSPFTYPSSSVWRWCWCWCWHWRGCFRCGGGWYFKFKHECYKPHHSPHGMV